MKNNHRTFVTGRSRGKMAMINYLANPPVRKLPRKKKKQFIRKNGRKAYKNWCKLESWIKSFLDKVHNEPIKRCYERPYNREKQNFYGFGRQVYVNNSV